jgi:hypothetical protein
MGETITLADIQKRFAVNRSTAWRMVQRANITPVSGGAGREILRIAASDLPKLRAVVGNRRKTER